MTDREEGLAALQRGDYEHAVNALERAHAASPDDFLILLYLGGAYHQTKRDPEAVRLLSRAVQLQPQSAQAHYNLGIALDRVRQPRAAIAMLERALVLQPDYPMAQHALLRLQTMPQHTVSSVSSRQTPDLASGEELTFTPLSTPYGTPPPPKPAPLLNASSAEIPASEAASLPAYGTMPGQPMPAPGYAPTAAPYPQYPVSHIPPDYAPPVAPYAPPGANVPLPYAPPYGQAPPPYGSSYQPYAGYPPLQVRSCPDATNALILSILGIIPCFFLGFLLGPLSIIKAVQAKRQIRDNPYLTGEGTANIAIVLGTLSTLVSTLPWLVRLTQ